MDHGPLQRLKRAVFILCLAPMAVLSLDAVRDRLGANPIAAIEHSTGRWALVLLLVTLSITPLRRLTGWYSLLRFRRLFGLYAFFYTCLHVLAYVVLDEYFDWSAITRDIVRLPFMSVGFASFVLLVPLALTSSNSMVRRLGSRRWQALHRLIYPIAIGGVLHYLWLVKLDRTQPELFGAILAVLLGFRVVTALGGVARRALAGRLPAGGVE